MIYLFYGSDTETVRTKAFAWVAAARAKEPRLIYARLLSGEINEETLAEVVGSGSLFVKRLLVLIDNPFGNEKDRANIFIKNIDSLASSDNAIIILAPGISPSIAKKITTKATKEYKFDRTTIKQTRGFNSALSNALGARDSKKLWIEIVRALRQGDAPEMVHGLLHWKVRDLMEKGSATWTHKDARKMSLRLISILSDSRRKGENLSVALERFALSI
ncbi:hypothetical protein MNBD_CPR01-363 [hydrothermal vent metagenome]|uniref:DNA polymerase III delta N-terminal domain-containing protein n=1 Tax=hydrothermal vent metagenome TaxID=652676 RepID=A0A3B0UP05_9ZZZZ